VTTLLDLVIGIVLLYSLLALLVTTLQELVASVLSTRAKQLYQALADVLKGTAPDGAKPLIDAFYEHPLIRNLATA
jgi:hypothetical protein